MKYKVIFFTILFPLILLGRTSNIEIDEDTLLKKVVKKEKIGSLFYLKTEILNTALRAFFVKHTYDIDVQATVRLSNHFHFVNTYGKTTFYLTEEQQSPVKPNLFMYSERIGTSSHRSSSMLRYYPFNDLHSWGDYIFIEGGVHFQKYKGKTNGEIYDTTSASTINLYTHFIDMYRYGPQINIGMSQYFQPSLGDEVEKPKLIFSPEFFIGISYSQIYTLRDETINYIGTIAHENYAEPKFSLNFRVKLGIGFF